MYTPLPPNLFKLEKNHFQSVHAFVINFANTHFFPITRIVFFYARPLLFLQIMNHVRVPVSSSYL